MNRTRKLYNNSVIKTKTKPHRSLTLNFEIMREKFPSLQVVLTNLMTWEMELGFVPNIFESISNGSLQSWNTLKVLTRPCSHSEKFHGCCSKQQVVLFATRFTIKNFLHPKNKFFHIKFAKCQNFVKCWLKSAIFSIHFNPNSNNTVKNNDSFGQ